MLTAERAMEITNEMYKEYTDVEWHGEIIRIKYYLDMDVEHSMYNSIISCAYDGDNPIPCLFDFAIKTNILSYYTNVQLPQDVNKLHKLIYCSDIIEVVKEHICAEQINFMIKIFIY